MKLQRVTDLTEPPIVGQYYLVPTVRGVWYNKIRWWPVLGDKHEDAKFFNFKEQHYHLDRRFLPECDIERATTAPLSASPTYGRNLTLTDTPEYKPRKCRRSMMWFPTLPLQVQKMQTSLAGAKCRTDAAGWVCPHRNFSLGSIAPDINGVILCPLHGLRIDAKTGIVITDHQEDAHD